MFPEDPGDEEVRATVHEWKLVRCKKDVLPLAMMHTGKRNGKIQTQSDRFLASKL